MEEQPAWRLGDEEDDDDLDAGSHGDPHLKLPPLLQFFDHFGCCDLAQAVGDEEGDGDEAVVADPGEPLEAPLEPNRLHQINLWAKALNQERGWRLPG